MAGEQEAPVPRDHGSRREARHAALRRAVGGQRVVEPWMLCHIVNGAQILQKESSHRLRWGAQPEKIDLLLAERGPQSQQIALVPQDIDDLEIAERTFERGGLLVTAPPYFYRCNHLIARVEAKTHQQV